MKIGHHENGGLGASGGQLWCLRVFWCVRTKALNIFWGICWLYFAHFWRSLNNWHLSISIRGNNSFFHQWIQLILRVISVEWHRKCTKKHFSDDNRKVIGAISITLKTWTIFYAIVIVVKCLSIIDECASQSVSSSLGQINKKYALLHGRRFSVKWLKWC